MVEQGTHKPLVESPNLSLGTLTRQPRRVLIQQCCEAPGRDIILLRGISSLMGTWQNGTLSDFPYAPQAI